MNSDSHASPSLPAPAGGIEALMARMDWSASELGAPATWPPALQYAVRFMLDARTPMFIAWGQAQAMLYNDAYVALLGRRHPAALGRPWAQVWPEVVDELRPAIARALSGETASYENAPFTLYRNGAAEQAWFTFSYAPVRCLDRRILGFSCTVTETTTQVQAEQRRQDEVSRILNLFEQSSSFIAVLSGPRHVYERANEAYYRFIGQRDVLGKSVSEVFPELHGQGYLEMLDQVYASGECASHLRAPVHLQRRLDGPIETRYIDFSFQPLCDRDGQVNGILIEGYDVTGHAEAEQRVRDNERLLQIERNRVAALLDAAPVGIAYADAGGGLQHFNAAIRQIWGGFPMSGSIDEYRDWRGWWADGTARHGQLVAPQEWALARALRSEAVTNDIVEIEPFDAPGTRKTLLLQAAPIRDEHGAIVSAVVAQIDISDKIRSERALRDANMRLEAALAAADMGTWSYDVQADKVYADRNLAQLFAVSEPDADGGSFAAYLNAIHPDDRASAQATIAAAIASGEAYAASYRVRRGDGGYRHILARGQVMRDDEGRPAWLPGVALDITPQKEAEERLSHSEAKFRVIANAMPQMVWSTRPDGYHDYYNDQWYQFTGSAEGGTDGDGWNGMFHPDDQARAFEQWTRSLRTGEPYEIEYRLRHRSGEYRWVLGRALPVRDEQGRVVRWMGTCTDIDEQKRTQEALREADQRKDEFLAMLAHELRNPLAPILAAADLLHLAKHDPARVEQLGKVVARQTRHMTELIDDLLDVSRVTRGLITLDLNVLDVKLLVQEAVEQVRPLIEARAHHLETHVEADSAMVRGDRKRLVQVLANLLTNAAKYTPNHGRIVLAISADAEHVAISVSDNGIGMSPDLLAHAFELFQQGQRTPDRSQGGLGIGLALVKSLVQQHGGTIRAHSAGEGRGSELVLMLPRLRQPVVAESGPKDAPGRPQADEALRILLVDDNVDAAQVMEMYLQMIGHDVVVEHGAVQALARARTVVPEVCLLDIGLPDMDGRVLAQRLRQVPGMETAVFAALTGYGQQQDRQATAEAGFSQHFVKPVETGKLAAWLGQVVALRGGRVTPPRG